MINRNSLAQAAWVVRADGLVRLSHRESKCTGSRMQAGTLPVRKYADKIVTAVKNNPVTVVIGETGSGKTTQISQVLLPCMQ